jgi:hypothetical protein
MLSDHPAIVFGLASRHSHGFPRGDDLGGLDKKEVIVCFNWSS